jgi:hypothetical protein
LGYTIIVPKLNLQLFLVPELWGQAPLKHRC